MEELRKTLGSRLLTINEYFVEAFKVFKRVWKKEKILSISVFVLPFTIEIIRFLPVIIMSLYSKGAFGGNQDKFIRIISNLNFNGFIVTEIMSGILALLMYFFSGKIVCLIEENKDKHKILKKAVILTLLYEIIKWMCVQGIYVLSYNTDRKFLPVIIQIISAVFYILFLNYFYFKFIYMARNTNIVNALEESFSLSKGNRMRMFLPNFIIIIVLNMLSILFRRIYMGIFFFFIVQAVIMIFQIIMQAIIYLNAEYIIRNKNIEGV